MKMLLVRDDLWKYVAGVTPEDGSMKDDYKRGDAKALAVIALGCEKSQFSLIVQCETAKAAWAKLQNNHQPKTAASKVALLRAILNKKYQDGEDMEKYFVHGL